VIKLQDLSRLHATIGPELQAAFDQSLARSDFIQGEAVASFEREFASFTGVQHCIGVANGTDALELALEALALAPGDVVIVPAMTFAATAEAVVRQGLHPHFADADPDTLCVGPDQLLEAIATAPRPPRACIAVHLYGRACVEEAFRRVLAQRGIALIEDCAQAHGARIGGRHVGNAGRIGCFSFYPGKNLGALGDAGALVTSDAELAQRVRSLRDHGRTSKYTHGEVGRNSRLDGLQARFLSVKLRHLEAWTAARRDIAALYEERLDRAAGIAPLARPDDLGRHVYHLYVVRVAGADGRRDALIRHLEASAISSGIHYPVPLHQQPAFARYAAGSLPEAARAAREVLSLPMDPLMTEKDVDEVCAALRGFNG
jgi:dTDP-4-amino-4,6-dideoxygalactose transaminase